MGHSRSRRRCEDVGRTCPLVPSRPSYFGGDDRRGQACSAVVPSAVGVSQCCLCALPGHVYRRFDCVHRGVPRDDLRFKRTFYCVARRNQLRPTERNEFETNNGTQ